MVIAETVRAHLKSRQVGYELIAHPRSHSSRETAAAAELREDHIAKGVLLRDSAGYVLAVIPGDSRVRLHSIAEELDRPLEVAPEQDVERLFDDCEPGAVPCTGTAYNVETIVDEALAALAFVYFEAGDHEHLVRVSADAFHALMAGLRHGHFSHAG
jgi:Ala-tRNA(Pro) deacylase